MKENLWWQKRVVYQIYPRSFMDSSHNGIGNLQDNYKPGESLYVEIGGIFCETNKKE